MTNTFYRPGIKYPSIWGDWFPDGDSPYAIILVCTALRTHESTEHEDEVALEADTPEQLVGLVRELGWELAEGGSCGVGYTVEEAVEVWAACPDCVGQETDKHTQ